MSLKNYKKNDSRMWIFYHPIGKWVIRIFIVIVILWGIWENWIQPLKN
jgi:hypothetical protein